jgi:hypothetical protein
MDTGTADCRLLVESRATCLSKTQGAIWEKEMVTKGHRGRASFLFGTFAELRDLRWLSRASDTTIPKKLKVVTKATGGRASFLFGPFASGL